MTRMRTLLETKPICRSGSKTVSRSNFNLKILLHVSWTVFTCKMKIANSRSRFTVKTNDLGLDVSQDLNPDADIRYLLK